MDAASASANETDYHDVGRWADDSLRTLVCLCAGFYFFRHVPVLVVVYRNASYQHSHFMRLGLYRAVVRYMGPQAALPF